MAFNHSVNHQSFIQLLIIDDTTYYRVYLLPHIVLTQSGLVGSHHPYSAPWRCITDLLSHRPADSRPKQISRPIPLRHFESFFFRCFRCENCISCCYICSLTTAPTRASTSTVFISLALWPFLVNPFTMADQHILADISQKLHDSLDPRTKDSGSFTCHTLHGLLLFDTVHI